VEPVRHRPWSDPLTLRGRLGYGFAHSVGGAFEPGPEAEVQKSHSCPEISGNPYKLVAAVAVSAGAKIPH
jgi:hypothetical protein